MHFIIIYEEEVSSACFLKMFFVSCRFLDRH